MDPLLTAIVQQSPAIAIAVGVIIAFSRGLLRTAFEVAAWKERAERAERQVDTLMPAMERLTDSVEKSAVLLEAALHPPRPEPRRE